MNANPETRAAHTLTRTEIGRIVIDAGTSRREIKLIGIEDATVVDMPNGTTCLLASFEDGPHLVAVRTCRGAIKVDGAMHSRKYGTWRGWGSMWSKVLTGSPLRNARARCSALELHQIATA